jgi:hypothetical protein
LAGTTTLDIAEDVLLAAKKRARHERKTTGQVISELARAGLRASEAVEQKLEDPLFRYGIRPFPKRGNTIVTNELVNKLRDGDVY